MDIITVLKTEKLFGSSVEQILDTNDPKAKAIGLQKMLKEAADIEMWNRQNRLRLKLEQRKKNK